MRHDATQVQRIGIGGCARQRITQHVICTREIATREERASG